jgi:hypothetical protein
LVFASDARTKKKHINKKNNSLSIAEDPIRNPTFNLFTFPRNAISAPKYKKISTRNMVQIAEKVALLYPFTDVVFFEATAIDTPTWIRVKT